MGWPQHLITPRRPVSPHPHSYLLRGRVVLGGLSIPKGLGDSLSGWLDPSGIPDPERTPGGMTIWMLPEHSGERAGIANNTGFLCSEQEWPEGGWGIRTIRLLYAMPQEGDTQCHLSIFALWYWEGGCQASLVLSWHPFTSLWLSKPKAPSSLPIIALPLQICVSFPLSHNLSPSLWDSRPCVWRSENIRCPDLLLSALFPWGRVSYWT